MDFVDRFCRWLRDERGAVTIDWVALTSGVLLLGLMVVYAIFGGGVDPLVESINETLAATSVAGSDGGDSTPSGPASGKACVKSLNMVVCFGPK